MSARLVFFVAALALALASCADSAGKGTDDERPDVRRPRNDAGTARDADPTDTNAQTDAPVASDPGGTDTAPAPDVSPDAPAPSDATDTTDIDDTTPDGPCTAGQLRCAPGTTDRVQRCNGLGTWVDEDLCASPTTCVDGTCRNEGDDCGTGDTRCIGRAVAEVCESGAWALRNCGDGELCVGDACRSAVCIPGERACVGDTVVTCTEAGQHGAVVETCGVGQCSAGVCTDPCAGDGKTYVGCEFWGADLDHMEPGDRQQYAVSVSNTSTAVVQVEVLNGAGQSVAAISIPPGQLSTLPVARQDVDHTSRSMRSYVVKSTGPVTVHQFNPLNQSGVASNDASLLLPTPTLGTSYLILGWPTVRSGRVPDGRAYMTMIATADDTTVTVTPRTAIEANGGVAAIAAGQTTTFTLSRGEVLSLGTPRTHGADLSGSEIVASRPIAVFFGHECADIPLGTCCCDHIEEQMLPLEYWGTDILAPKFESRGTEADLWRILASEDGTTVTLNPPAGGVSTFTLQRGEHREVMSTTSFRVEATAPVKVGQFLIGSSGSGVGRRGCSGFLAGNAGDPAYTLNVPTSRWLSEYIVLIPQGFTANFLSVVTLAGTDVTINGAPLGVSATAIGTTGASLLRKEVTAGVHRLSGTRPFGLYAYGYDCYVSYAYPGGLGIAP